MKIIKYEKLELTEDEKEHIYKIRTLLREISSNSLDHDLLVSAHALQEKLENFESYIDNWR